MKGNHVFLNELDANSKTYKVKVKIVGKCRPRKSAQKKTEYQSLLLEDDKVSSVFFVASNVVNPSPSADTNQKMVITNVAAVSDNVTDTAATEVEKGMPRKLTEFAPTTLAKVVNQAVNPPTRRTQGKVVTAESVHAKSGN